MTDITHLPVQCCKMGGNKDTSRVIPFPFSPYSSRVCDILKHHIHQFISLTLFKNRITLL